MVVCSGHLRDFSVLQTARFPLVIIGTLLLGGCAEGLFEDNAPAHARLIDDISYTQTASYAPQTWYRSFGDETLTALVDKGLPANLTLVQAIARIDAAQEQARLSQAGRLPSIDATANTTKSWEDGNAQDLTSRFGATLEWEADIFGRLSAAAKSDRLLAAAAQEDAQALRLSLAADIANAYYQSVAVQRTLALLDEQIQTGKDILTIITLREEQGLGTQIDVLQQESEQALIYSLFPVSQASLRQFENRLDVLTGNKPDALDVTTPASRFPDKTLQPPLSIPSEILLERPDLRAARARLAAADADIEAAIAERLPRVTLSGSYLLASGGNVASPLLSLLGGLVQPLLDWGEKQAQVKRNKALYQERLSALSQLYLEAIEDVETTLYQISMQKEYIDRLDNRRRILSDTVEKTRAVYTEGLSDYLPVLQALQDLQAVERTMINEERDLVLLHVQLYRATGGYIPPQETT